MSADRHEPSATAADPGSAAAAATSATPEPSADGAPVAGEGSETTVELTDPPAAPAAEQGGADPDGTGAEPAAADGEVPAPSAPEPAQASDPDGAAAPAAEVDELAAATARAEEYLSLAQRTKADFDNYRKRAARDAALAAERGVLKLAKELLPALDNLERAITHAPAEDPLLEGIKLVRSDLLGALARAGIEPFSPAGESFDPQLHEAVAQHPCEGTETGTVIEVYQPGYRLADTVLRPARVLVAA